MLGIKQQHTTAYHPQANGMVERLHRLLKEALKASTTSLHWMEHLSFILLGLGTTWRKEPGYSPAKSVYGSSSFEGYPLQVRHKQDWGPGFILLLPQTAALPESDAGSDVIKPASSFVIQNRQTSYSMWCPMYCI